jgi:hypothetical protein
VEGLEVQSQCFHRGTESLTLMFLLSLTI